MQTDKRNCHTRAPLNEFCIVVHVFAWKSCLTFGICFRVKRFLVLTVAQTTQKLLSSQAASQVARIPTRVHASILLILETQECIVTFTTGSA